MYFIFWFVSGLFLGMYGTWYIVLGRDRYSKIGGYNGDNAANSKESA